MKTYIENKGTIIQHNGNCNFKKYIKKNRTRKCFKKNLNLIKKEPFPFTKSDLSTILGIHSIPLPIEERLERDFLQPLSFSSPSPDPSPYNPNPYLFRVSIPSRNKIKSKKNRLNKNKSLHKSKLLSMNSSLSSSSHNLSPLSFISSLDSILPETNSTILSKKLNGSFKPKKLTYKTPLPKTIRIHLGSEYKNNKTRNIRNKL